MNIGLRLDYNVKENCCYVIVTRGGAMPDVLRYSLAMDTGSIFYVLKVFFKHYVEIRRMRHEERNQPRVTD